MILRHDYAGTLQMLCPEPPEMPTPLSMGQRVEVGHRVGSITGATAPHEAGAKGLVFVTFDDAPPDRPAQEFVPGVLGLRWKPAPS